MALLHKATIAPGKLELLAAWLPGRSWYDGPAVEPERVAGATLTGTWDTGSAVLVVLA